MLRNGWRDARARALSLIGALGCGHDGGLTGGGASADSTSGTSSVDVSSGSTSAGLGGSGGGAPIPITPACVAEGEPTYQPFSNEPPQVPLCEDPDTLPLPTQAYLVDLSDAVAGGGLATCGPHFLDGREAPIPIDAASGPLVLRLPALAAADPACASLCGDVPEPTAFGITVVLPELATGDRLLAIRVPAPWFLVIGNEHSPTPCLDGSPSALEYGQPLACAITWGDHIGFATADTSAPSVDVVIDAIEPGAVATPMCCPYHCD